MPQYWSATVPAVLLLLQAIWLGRMNRSAAFRVPPEPYWPFAENAGLALQLSDSAAAVDSVLGEADTEVGKANRETAVRRQYLDFVFIPLYTLFFLSVAWAIGQWRWWLLITVSALTTAALDVLEDVQIIRLVKGKGGGSTSWFGRAKWLFYFVTLGTEGLPLLAPGRQIAEMVLGVFLLANAMGGIAAAIRGSFNGILSASKLSALGLVSLAAMPLLTMLPVSWWVAAEYAFLIRVPLVVGSVLIALPFLAFHTGARTLLRGLFDLTPLSLFVVTLTTFGVAGTACRTAAIVLLHAEERLGWRNHVTPDLPPGEVWLLIITAISLPLLSYAVWFSVQQQHGLVACLGAALAGAASALAICVGLLAKAPVFASAVRQTDFGKQFEIWLANTQLFAGYVRLGGGGERDPWSDHLSALAAFLSTAVLYVAVGVYGRWRLGRSRTVPALGSALMLLLILGWLISGVAFFFDAWRIPILLIIGIAGTLTAQSDQSDHFYCLRKRSSNTPAPDPIQTLTAQGRRRVIVVAANGGGIQAGAWAAQVLTGLEQENPIRFREALRLISSVSGGSVGSAYFVHWLAKPDEAKLPSEAAVQSSLDEVAWGLAWTDFLRGLLPWIFGGWIGRGRALEMAWRLNSASNLQQAGQMDEPLSEWNASATSGALPAVLMNATIAETGERLLLATTHLTKIDTPGRARVDAAELHAINGVSWDVGVVTAARLSASFPYVTPAARSNGFGPQPHIVDGGYYDNYGMATTVEWLDDALTGAGGHVESVLVVQIRGAPVNQDARQRRHAKSRGWFYQAIAPLTTLAAVRSAGQIAHNDIELTMLQQKWMAAGIPIHNVTFEFSNANAPLSWHLVPDEIDAIRNDWNTKMDTKRRQVKDFLDGSDNLDCACPRCTEPTTP